MSLTKSESCSRAGSGPWDGGHDPSSGHTEGIEGLLRAARTRLTRLLPEAAHVAHRRGAVLVDIRPVAQRTAAGEIPGALLIERNVLEWRLDPTSEARLPIADRHDLPIVLVCQEGYASSLAAATLQDLGLFQATDVVGGFAAWLAAGLPAYPPRPADPAWPAGPASAPRSAVAALAYR